MSYVGWQVDVMIGVHILGAGLTTRVMGWFGLLGYMLGHIAYAFFGR